MARSLFAKRLLAAATLEQSTICPSSAYYSFPKRVLRRVDKARPKAAYREGKIIPLSDDLCMYQRRQGDGRYCYARLSIDPALRPLAQHRRMVVKSLRTDDEGLAVSRAHEFRIRTLTLLEAGQPVGRKTLREAVADYFRHYDENLRSGKGGFTQKMQEQFEVALNRLVGFLPRNQVLAAVTSKDLDRYEAYRRNPPPLSKKVLEAMLVAKADFRRRDHRRVVRNSDNPRRDTLTRTHPSFSLLSKTLGTEEIRAGHLNAAQQFNKPPAYKTLYLEFYAIRKFLTWCNANGLYAGNAFAHELRKNSEDRKKREQRSELTLAEYRRLTRFMTRREFLSPNARNALTEYSNRLMRCMILLLANSGCRPGEVRDLRWRDIKSSKTKDGEEIAEFSVKTTTSKVRQHREVVARKTALKALRDFRHYRDRIGRFNSDEDFIFANY